MSSFLEANAFFQTLFSTVYVPPKPYQSQFSVMTPLSYFPSGVISVMKRMYTFPIENKRGSLGRISISIHDSNVDPHVEVSGDTVLIEWWFSQFGMAQHISNLVKYDINADMPLYHIHIGVTNTLNAMTKMLLESAQKRN